MSPFAFQHSAACKRGAQTAQLPVARGQQNPAMLPRRRAGRLAPASFAVHTVAAEAAEVRGRLAASTGEFALAGREHWARNRRHGPLQRHPVPGDMIGTETCDDPSACLRRQAQ